MSEWRRCRLEEVVRLKRGFDLPSSSRRMGPFPVMGSAGISGWHDEGPIVGPAVVLGRAGASMGVASYCAVDRFWPLNTSLFVEDFLGNDPRFIFYLFQATDLRGFNSGSVQPMLNRNYIRNVLINIPDLPEQVRISSILGILDDKIQVNDRIADATGSLAKARYLYGARRADRRVMLREIIDLRYGKALLEDAREPGAIPVFGSNGRSGWHSSALCSGPGIIVGRKGANAGSINWSQTPFWAIDTAFYVSPKSPDFSMEYLYLLLDGVDFRNLVGDSAIPGLNREIALASTARLPATETIHQVSSQIRPLLEVRSQVAAESAALAKLRDALLPKLMSRKIRVREAERIVEDAT